MEFKQFAGSWEFPDSSNAQKPAPDQPLAGLKIEITGAVEPITNQKPNQFRSEPAAQPPTRANTPQPTRRHILDNYRR